MYATYVPAFSLGAVGVLKQPRDALGWRRMNIRKVICSALGVSEQRLRDPSKLKLAGLGRGGEIG